MLYTKKSGAHLRIIDGGSGYLCEMEPVAHFGLGESGMAVDHNLHPAEMFRSWRVGSEGVKGRKAEKQLYEEGHDGQNAEGATHVFPESQSPENNCSHFH